MQYSRVLWFYIIIILCSTKSTKQDEPKIIIIGAGAAGIAAASKLYENGFNNITILEAESRIGGRVHTVWFGENWIDLGGQWVHGETNNVVFELAFPLGVLEVPVDDFLVTIHDSKGSQIPSAVTADLMKLYNDIAEKIPEDSKGYNGSIGDYFTRALTTEAGKYSAINQTMLKQSIWIYEGLRNSMDAADSWFDSSASGNLEYWTCPGNQDVNWKNKGYSTILDILMKKYPHRKNELPVLNNTLLNSEVVKIDYNLVRGKVLIETNNLHSYTADHVIMTASLGVLKAQYDTLFIPNLPEYKVRTIKGLSFGSVGKIFLSFETTWWPVPKFASVFLWNDEDRQLYKNDPDKKWLLDVHMIYTVEHKPRILSCWVNGQGSRHMERLSEEQVLNHTMALIDMFLGKSFNVSRPTAIRRTNWYSNKHFRGTYSLRTMESEKADVWADQLAVPLLVDEKPVLMFAGEATHTHYFTTVHGAIESGFREAKRLIDMYKVEDSTTNATL